MVLLLTKLAPPGGPVRMFDQKRPGCRWETYGSAARDVVAIEMEDMLSDMGGRGDRGIAFPVINEGTSRSSARSRGRLDKGIQGRRTRDDAKKSDAEECILEIASSDRGSSSV